MHGGVRCGVSCELSETSETREAIELIQLQETTGDSMLPTGSGGLLPKFLLLRTVSRRAAIPILPALQRRAVGGKADAEDDKPVVYSTSKAAKWKAEQSFRSEIPDAPGVQRWSVLASVVIFMVYFLILREENEFDQHLVRPLSETIPGIDKVLPPPPAPAPTKWVPPAWRG